MASPAPQPGRAAAAPPAAEALRAAWIARLAPADAAEEALVDLLVATFRRGLLLDAIEDALLARLARGEDPPPGLGLATLARYRARLERDRRALLDELGTMRLAAALHQGPRRTREAPAAAEGRSAGRAEARAEAGAGAAEAGASSLRAPAQARGIPDARATQKTRETANAPGLKSQPVLGRAPASGPAWGSPAAALDPLAVLLATSRAEGGGPAARMRDPIDGAGTGLGPLAHRLAASASAAAMAA
ncbi:MAG: hypothetical protein NZ555_02950 [Geminicoccaceae bacterium]|nr:hypothetical protein [Geminicoccaceae bacterium]MCX8100574.1 hypothetical protein [Geminicoccaceae bacterium]MDW8369281.1 hypothetical protein [Geminicoccaceae bacterium]